jgi:hypothetical protein
MKQTQEQLKQLETICGDIGKTIHRAVPPGVGYALLVFDMGEAGWMTYASNAERVDMVKAMRELADKMDRALFGGAKA